MAGPSLTKSNSSLRRPAKAAGDYPGGRVGRSRLLLVVLVVKLILWRILSLLSLAWLSCSGRQQWLGISSGLELGFGSVSKYRALRPCIHSAKLGALNTPQSDKMMSLVILRRMACVCMPEMLAVLFVGECILRLGAHCTSSQGRARVRGLRNAYGRGSGG